MKILIPALVFMPFLAASQDCSQLLMVEKDSFSNEVVVHSLKNVSATSKEIGLGSLTIELWSVKKDSYLVTFEIGEGVWFYGKEKIWILFQDNDKLEFSNVDKVNYKGQASFFINLVKPEQKEKHKKLSTKKIKAVKVDFFPADLTDEDAEFLRRQIECMTIVER